MHVRPRDGARDTALAFRRRVYQHRASMPGVTIIWSMCAAMSLLVAGIHLLVWVRQRTAWSSLALALMSASVAVAAVAEYSLMHAATLEEFAAILRWANFPIVTVFLSMAWLVHLEFGTGSLLLGAIAVGLRALALVLGYFPGETTVFREITALGELQWLGERIVVVSGAIATPWSWLPVLSNLALAAFVADAGVRLWRHGGREDRARALRVAVPLTAFILGSSSVALLINARVMHVPYITSPSYLVVVLVLGYELSRSLLRAQHLVSELQQSERRLHLAGEAAGIGLWFYNRKTGVLWATDQAKSILAFPNDGDLTFGMFMDRVHPEDRALVEARIEAAVRGDGRYVAEYRVVLPDGSIRWISARGEASHHADQSAASLIGVAIDITERRQSELELAEQRTQLAHLARVTTVSELSGSIAHEINQPLAIILTNAQAAQRLLAKDPPDLAEAREILGDISHEAQRAGEVIRRVRGLLRHGQVNLEPVTVRALLDEVLHLLRRDLDNHGVRVRVEVPAGLPRVRGDAIQLQQVFLNLILNACEAMGSCPPHERVLVVSARCLDGHVRLSVADTGCGPPLDLQRVFEPFYTTKSDGLGLGLPICRSIVTAHGGTLWAEIRPASQPERAHGGSVFHVELDAVPRD